MVISIEDFFCRLHKYLVYVIFFLVIVMIPIKYRIHSLKKEIRKIESSIVELSYSKDTLKAELNYLTNPERLNDIYKKLVDDKIIDEQIIISYNKIKNTVNLDSYYAKKYKSIKKTNTVVSNGK